MLYTVDINKKKQKKTGFVLRLFYGVSTVEKNGVKSVMFACCTPFLRVSSIHVKFLNAYTRCSSYVVHVAEEASNFL